MEDLKKYYGKVLREIRRMRGLTAEEIGKRMKINAQTVYGYERGLYLPKTKNAEQLFSILRIDQKIFENSIENSVEDVAVSNVKVNLDGSIPENERSHGIEQQRIDVNEMANEIIQKSYDASKRLVTESPTNQIESNAEVVTNLQGEWLPVISEAAAAECNPGLMPLLDCVNQFSDEKAFFTMGHKDDFVIRVTGSSMMPWYPPGTLLLVRPYQDILNGKRIVAVLDDGEIIFKIYARTKDKQIALMSINDDGGKDYLFPPSGKGIRYICRVVQSIRNEDDLDDAMMFSGIHHAWEQKLHDLNNK